MRDVYFSPDDMSECISFYRRTLEQLFSDIEDIKKIKSESFHYQKIDDIEKNLKKQLDAIEKLIVVLEKALCSYSEAETNALFVIKKEIISSHKSGYKDIFIERSADTEISSLIGNSAFSGNEFLQELIVRSMTHEKK